MRIRIGRACGGRFALHRGVITSATALMAGSSRARSRAAARRSAPVVPPRRPLALPFGMLCIILTECAHCGRKVTVLDTLSTRLDCEEYRNGYFTGRRLEARQKSPWKTRFFVPGGSRALDRFEGLHGSLQGPAYAQTLSPQKKNKKRNTIRQLTASR